MKNIQRERKAQGGTEEQRVRMERMNKGYGRNTNRLL
jgi:hypothetical protein